MANHLSNKPNFLIVTADELSCFATPWHPGCRARTPNMERLLRLGLAFDRAYCASPVCSASRAAFWTGMLPSRNGIYENSQAEDPAGTRDYPKSRPTLGSLLREHGYNAIHWGKKHDAGTLRGFEHIPTVAREPEYDCPWLPGGVAAKTDGFVAQGIAEFLENPGDEPFAAVADIDNPHDICVWMKKMTGMNELPTLPEGSPPLPELPDNFETMDVETRGNPVKKHWQEHVACKLVGDWTLEKWRHYLWAYDRYVELFDAKLGVILDAWLQSPVRDRAWLWFWSDHGEGMAQHREITKGTLFYESTTRVPLLVAGPGVKPARESALVSLIDVAPTICELAGIPAPQTMQGRSLTTFLEGATPDAWRDRIICEWREHEHNRQTGRMLRSERYKYIHYLRGGEELYDLEQDPGEQHNLAADSRFKTTLQLYRRLLRQHTEESGDDYFNLIVKE